MSSMITSSHGVYFGKSSMSYVGSENLSHVKRTKVIPKNDSSEYKGKIAPWGADNQFPSKLLKAVKLNGAASGGLGILKSVHYGKGLTFYSHQEKEGKRVVVPEFLEDHPEMNSFYVSNKIGLKYPEIIADLEILGIAFPTYILSKDFKRMISVGRQKAAWCRRELMNPKTGHSEHVYIKSSWEDETTADAVKIASVDPEWSFEEIKAYCQEKGIYEFILPIHYPMMDESYYPHNSWHCAYYNGWIEVSNSIPKLKKYLFENQLNIKFMVYISQDYFKDEYGDDWDDKDKYPLEKKKEIQKALVTAIDKHLSGNEASGRSMYSRKIMDMQGNWVNGIEVTPLDNKIKDGSFLPEASAANSEVLFALAVDASLIGSEVPGGKMGAGSGSDKRVAFNILAALFHTKRMVSLQLWAIIHAWNEYGLDIHFKFENMLLTTLDKNPKGKETGI